MLDTLTERKINCEFNRARFGTYLDILLKGTETEGKKLDILAMKNALDGIRRCRCSLCSQILNKLEEVVEISLRK